MEIRAVAAKRTKLEKIAEGSNTILGRVHEQGVQRVQYTHRIHHNTMWKDGRLLNVLTAFILSNSSTRSHYSLSETWGKLISRIIGNHFIYVELLRNKCQLILIFGLKKTLLLCTVLRYPSPLPSKTFKDYFLLPQLKSVFNLFIVELLSE